MATQALRTNGFLKRQHPESASVVSEIIELSNSDENVPHPSKRQKSITPTNNGINNVNSRKISFQPSADKGKPSPTTKSRASTPSQPSTKLNANQLSSKPITFKLVNSDSLNKKADLIKSKDIRKQTNNKPPKPSSRQLLLQSTSSSTPKSTSSQPPRVRESTRPSPARDRYKPDSEDDDLKILEHFRITGDSSKQDRLIPQKAPVATRTVARSDPSKQASTPIQSNIRVEVPYRHSPASSPSASKNHLTSTPLPTPFKTSSKEVNSPYQIVPSPSQSKQVQVVVPRSQDARQGARSNKINYEKERKQLLADLRKSTEPIKTRLAEIETYFGQNGFSQAFSTYQDDIRVLNAASKKKRQVNRDSIILKWGEPRSSAVKAQSNKANGTSTKLVHPSQQVKQLLTARFREERFPPLTFANDINDRRLNGKFQFVDRYIYGPGVRVAPESTNHGCGCAGACQPETCSCLFHRFGDSRFPTTQQVVTYQRRNDGLVVLSEEYMANELTPSVSHFEISECNDTCSCGTSCFNRVVTRGRTLPLEIFETPKCGFGVRSGVNIVRGQFIDLYLGEVLTQQDVERREKAKEENASSYVYSLDWFTQQNCYHVDGEIFGTAMRFINHNCSPNARNFTVKTHKEDKHVYSLAFFAIKDIPAGTEICIDYSPQEDGKYLELASVDDSVGSTAEEIEDEEHENDGRARCYCGAENCRKFLWRSPPRKRKKRKTTKHD